MRRLSPKSSALLSLALAILLGIIALSMAISRVGGGDSAGRGARSSQSTPPPTLPPTPEPTPEPYDPLVEERDSSAPAHYFDDAAFVGNSLVTGLDMYDYDNVLDGATFFAENSVTVLSVDSELSKMEADGTSFGKIYIGLGTNEMSYDRDELRRLFGELVDTLKSRYPGASIYLMNLPPVSEYKSSTDSVFTKALTDEMNEMLFSVATDKEIYYLDVNSVLGDEDGFLPGDVTADGIHFTPSHYQYWFDYLLTHYV